ncbi:MAG: hypothetical protein R2911_03050 [Caldilineaceae bacterium]
MDDYLDFELHIGAGDGNTYPISVIRAAAGGEPSAAAAIPINDEALRQQLNELIGVRRATGRPRHWPAPF